MKTGILTLVLIVLTFLACKKGKLRDGIDEVLQDSVVISGALGNGSISGSISPVDAARILTATISINGKLEIYQTFPDANGNYLFNAVPAGTYSLVVGADNKFIAPEKFSIVVKPLQTSKLGLITLKRKAYGGISGKISPAGAALKVQAINSAGEILSSTVPDPSTGAFEIPDLEIGEYGVRLIPAQSFTAPVTQKLTVVANQTINAGIYQFDSYGSISTLKFKAGILDHSMKGTASLIKGILNLSGTLTVNSSIPRVSGTKYTFTMKLENINVPGTYVCSPGSSSSLSYSATQVMGGLLYSTRNNGSSASVVIKEIDNIAGTITGVFDGKLISNPFSASPAKSVDITGGTFKASFR